VTILMHRFLQISFTIKSVIFATVATICQKPMIYMNLTSLCVASTS